MNRNTPFKRSDRIAERIYKLFCEAMMLEIRDPRLKNVFILSVTLTPDLGIARVQYTFSPFSETKNKEIKKALEGISGFLKRIISKNIVLKSIPKIEFFYDSGMDAQENIERLLREVNNAT